MGWLEDHYGWQQVFNLFIAASILSTILAALLNMANFKLLNSKESATAHTSQEETHPLIDRKQQG